MKRKSIIIIFISILLLGIFIVIRKSIYSIENKGFGFDKMHSKVQIDSLLSLSVNSIPNNPTQAEELLNEAVKLIPKKATNSIKAALRKVSGQIALEQTDYPNALKHFIEASNLYKAETDLSVEEKIQYGNTLNYISQIYFLLNRNDKAMEYLTMSLGIYESINSTENIINTYRNMGSIFYNQKKYKEALHAYKYLLDMDSVANSPDDLVVLYFNLGAVNFSLNRLDSSIFYLDEAERVTNKFLENDHQNSKILKKLSGIYYNKAIYYKAVNKEKLYLDYLWKSKNTLENIYAPAEIYPALIDLHQYYKQQGDYKNAYNLLVQSQDVRDSLFNIEKTHQIARIEEQQQRFKEQQELEKQKRDIERRYWIIMTALMFILILVLMYLQIQKNKIIRSEKEMLRLAENKNLLESHIDEQEEILHQKEHKVKVLALKIEEKDQNILSLEDKIHQINITLQKHIHHYKISDLTKPTKSSPEREEERKSILLSLEQISIPITEKLEQRFGLLTTRQKQLVALIKYEFTAKEISILFNISHKSVQTAKYRLKKTFHLKPEERLEEFLKNLK